ncbi:MAG: Lrp/AsnC family transcriptional regulator [Acidobacteriota bacterium]
MFDSKDIEIMTILQSNARTSNADIARAVDLTPSAVLERIRKLERRGALRGYHANIDPEQVGRGLLAYVFVRSNESLGDERVSHELAAISEVQEVHHVAGEDCYLVKVRTSSPQTLSVLIRERFGRIPAVLTTRSTIVLETVKEAPYLPLPRSEGEGEDAEDKKSGGTRDDD